MVEIFSQKLGKTIGFYRIRNNIGYRCSKMKVVSVCLSGQFLVFSLGIEEEMAASFGKKNNNILR